MKVQFASNAIARTNFKHARILIVEDNQDHQLIIGKAIKQCLPEVTPVFMSSKDQTMAYLIQSQLEEWDFPKLILLDLYLPNREVGWQLLEYIRSIPTALGRVPVILFSYSNNQSDITEAYDRGCSSYSIKPSGFNEWLDYFKSLRTYWWETVSLPKSGKAIF